MRRQAILSFAAITCLLAGCNQPAVSLKLPATQSSENTVRDWNDVADTIAAGMAVNGLIPTVGGPQVNAPAPVFIRSQAPDSTFVHEVAARLESDVLRSGGTIARTPEGVTVVNLGVTVVKWGPRDKPPGLLGTTAALLATPAIVMAPSFPIETWVAADAVGATAAGIGILADGIIAMTPTMNAEAVWSATVVTSDRVVMKLGDPVYIRADDIPLYSARVTLGPVVSWTSAMPLRTRMIRFDP